MSKMTYQTKLGGTIQIGYRSPGLSESLDAEEKMKLAVELGMEVIEPQMIGREFPDDNSYRKYAAAAQEHGITIPSAGSFPDIFDPAKQDTVTDELKQFVKRGKILGVKFIFACLRYPPDEMPEPEAWKLAAKHIAAFADIAADDGIQLALEPEYFIGSCERIERLICLSEREELLLNYDPTNLYLFGSDPVEALERNSHRVLNGHIKDGVVRGKNHNEVPVGEGDIDYPEIFKHLLNRKEDITLHIEHCTQAEQVRQAAEHIRAVMEKLGDLVQV